MDLFQGTPGRLYVVGTLLPLAAYLIGAIQLLWTFGTARTARPG